MANEKKLDVVILGLLSHEDLSGYDIKKRMDQILSYFWSASYGSIYPTLSQLVNQRLAEAVKDSSNDRRRTIYHITEDGRKYLSEWLQKPDRKDDLHSETALKVFFGGCTDISDTLQQIQAFEAENKEKLLQLKAAESQLQNVISEAQDHPYYLLTVRLGIATYSAWLSWCHEVKKYLKNQNHQ